jgi:hypothetical protein
MKLKIAEDLSLQLDAATQTLLIFGKRGSGKSSTATRFAEELIAAAVPIAVLDPVDVWWGLKAGKTGQREGGQEVYVFGGAHADLPLESTAGALMADTLVDHRINAVFVLRSFSNKEKARFVSDFAERLFARNRAAMHLFCEEAHELMPQKPYGGEEEMLGRMTRLQKLGRTSGIGLTSITQRPASLNTNARTQAEILIAHRILGPHDRDAIDDWIKYHNVQDERQAVMESLANLKTGEAWIWAPDFPEERPIGLRRVKMLLPETFDSRRTPKPGETAKQPKALAAVDLEKLRDKMAATIEKAKAEDPRELRKQIAELKKGAIAPDIVKCPACGQPPTRESLAHGFILPWKCPHCRVGVLRWADIHKEKNRETKTVEKYVLKDGQLARAEGIVKSLTNEAERHERFVKGRLDLLRELTEEIAAAIAKTHAPQPHPQATRTQTGVRASPQGRPTASTAAAARRPASLVSPLSNGDIQIGRGGDYRMLIALAQHPEGISDSKLAILAGMTKRGGSFRTYLSKLRIAGYVTGDRGHLTITDAGRHAAGDYEPLPSGEALIDYWRRELGDAGSRKIFDALVDVYPRALTKGEVAEAARMEMAGGSFRTYVSKLRVMGLIEGTSELRASEELFS